METERPISSPYKGIYGSRTAIEKERMNASTMTRTTFFFSKTTNVYLEIFKNFLLLEKLHLCLDVCFFEQGERNSQIFKNFVNG